MPGDLAARLALLRRHADELRGEKLALDRLDRGVAGMAESQWLRGTLKAALGAARSVDRPRDRRPLPRLSAARSLIPGYAGDAMWPVFADPKTDFVFKRIFGAEDRKHLLIGLLNALLELDDAHRIVELQHLPVEQRIAINELKLSIVDIKCTDATGTRYVVEMQLLHVEGFEKHVVYNVAKAYAMQLRGGNDYPTLNDVVGVTICDFALWPERDERGAFQIPMLSLWRMQEQHRGALGLSQLRFAFLELPKYEAADAPRTLVEKWAYFFREAKNLEVIPPALAEPPFLEAFEVARVVHFTPEEWDAYDRAKIAEQDARGALTMAERKGHEQGRQTGRLEEKRAMLQKVLSPRGLSDAHRARIAACEDAAELDAWIDRALAGAAPDELFGSAG